MSPQNYYRLQVLLLHKSCLSAPPKFFWQDKDQPQSPPVFLHTLGFLCKNAETEPAVRHEYRTKGKCRSNRHSEALPRPLLYPVMLTGTEILSDKGRNCNSERTIEHPEKAIDLSKRSPRHHRIHAKCIDGCLHNNV